MSTSEFIHILTDEEAEAFRKIKNMIAEMVYRIDLRKIES